MKTHRLCVIEPWGSRYPGQNKKRTNVQFRLYIFIRSCYNLYCLEKSIADLVWALNTPTLVLFSTE